MKSGRQFEKPPFSLAAYIPALVMLMAALLLLAWAFLQPTLSPDQRILANLFYAIVIGSMGFFWGGIILRITGRLSSHIRVAVRALGGSALCLLALWHPLFSSPNARNTHRLSITQPLSGSVVDPTVEVHGFTPYPQWRHYIVVTGVAGGDAIQDSTITVSPSGEIAGRATLGNSAVGAGQDYALQIFATRTSIGTDRQNVPRDAIFSDTTVVRRMPAEGGK